MPTHVQRVRSLYKTILRLHRSLPIEARAIGDPYVKDEFRRHKTAKPAEAVIFMKEWSEYAVILASQLQPKLVSGNKPDIGKNMNEADLEALRAEQIVQLYELFKATPKGKNLDGDN